MIAEFVRITDEQIQFYRDSNAESIVIRSGIIAYRIFICLWDKWKTGQHAATFEEIANACGKASYKDEWVSKAVSSMNNKYMPDNIRAVNHNRVGYSLDIPSAVSVDDQRSVNSAERNGAGTSVDEAVYGGFYYIYFLDATQKPVFGRVRLSWPGGTGKFEMVLSRTQAAECEPMDRILRTSEQERDNMILSINRDSPPGYQYYAGELCKDEYGRNYAALLHEHKSGIMKQVIFRRIIPLVGAEHISLALVAVMTSANQIYEKAVFSYMLLSVSEIPASDSAELTKYLKPDARKLQKDLFKNDDDIYLWAIKRWNNHAAE